MNSLRGVCVRAALTLTFCAAAAGAASTAKDAALVKKGEYLARAADCMPCHTGNRAQPYAGGLPIHTPFGILYSTNITSDPQTGIGNWTFTDFRDALHNGIRADGAFLYPAMPFDAYTKITEPDLEALWTYVHSLPPIHTPDLPNQLAFPFDIRSGMLAWRELFFQPGYFQPTSGKSAAWNRGAYLVEALAHCSDCHSPRNVAGAIIGKATYTGTEIDGFYAPDTASSALVTVQVARWADRRPAALLRTDGSNIRMAPMRGWIIGLSLTMASLWPAAAFCEGTAADIPYAATPAPPRASTPIPAVLVDISVMPAGPVTWVYPVTSAAAPVLALWRESLRKDLERAGLFSGNGPPLSLSVRIMQLTVSGNTVTVFAHYQLWRPGAEQPLTDIDILTDAGVTSTYAINPTIDSGQVMLDPRRIGDAIGLNIADFVLRLEDYAAQHPDWATLADRAAPQE